MSDNTQELREKLETAYKLARAATDTDEGRKAIDFFYHVHLNSYPGFVYKPKSQTNQAVLEALDRVEKELPNPDKTDNYDRADLLEVLNEIQDAISILRKELDGGQSDE